MNANRDFDRIAQAWLAEGPSELADRVLDAALDEIHLTNQRRRPTVPWRLPHMNTPLRLAAAVAIIAVVGYAGLTYFLPGAGPGVDVTPSPSPSPSPTPPPPPLTEGVLEPGRYSYDGTNVRVILTVPAGWEGGGFHVSTASGRELPDGANLGFRQPMIVFNDPCAPEGSARNIGLTVADLVTEMSDLPNVTDFAQEDVTISGFSGTHLSFVVDTEGIDCVMGLYQQLDLIRAADNGQHQDLWILDVAGTRLVIDAATYPDTSAGVIAEVQAMVDTLVIEPID